MGHALRFSKCHIELHCLLVTTLVLILSVSGLNAGKTMLWQWQAILLAFSGIVGFLF